MSPFYAYARLGANDDVNWRYIIVFSSRAVADAWWRLVSTSTDSQVAGSIQRISPQFYTHAYNNGKILIADTIRENHVAASLGNQILFTLQTNRDQTVPFEVIPPVPSNFADHLSGGWFYIRTPGPNPVYWYYLSNLDNHAGAIVAARNQSTRFHITAVDGSIKDGTVLINSDEVELSFAGGKIQIAGDGSLVSAADKADEFSFGNLFGGSGGFRINGYGHTRVASLPNSAIMKMNKDDGDAQVWELSLEGICNDN